MDRSTCTGSCIKWLPREGGLIIKTDLLNSSCSDYAGADNLCLRLSRREEARAAPLSPDLICCNSEVLFCFQEISEWISFCSGISWRVIDLVVLFFFPIV